MAFTTGRIHTGSVGCAITVIAASAMARGKGRDGPCKRFLQERRRPPGCPVSVESTINNMPERSLAALSSVPALEIIDLHAWHDDIHALRGVNLEIPVGQVAAFLGRPGSGHD